MIAMVLAVFAVNSIDVQSPTSCLNGADVMVAVDAVGGLDTAESVRVVVEQADKGSGIDPLVLSIDIELVNAPPLHRVAPLREIECNDVPDLVAVLVANQRRA